MNTTTFVTPQKSPQPGARRLKQRLAPLAVAGALAMQLLQNASAQVAFTLTGEDDKRTVATGDDYLLKAGFGQTFNAALHVPHIPSDDLLAVQHSSQYSVITSRRISGFGTALVDRVSGSSGATADSRLSVRFTVTRPGTYLFSASCAGGQLEDFVKLRKIAGGNNRTIEKVSKSGSANVSGALETGTYLLEAECHAQASSPSRYAGSWRCELIFDSTSSIRNVVFNRTSSGNTATLDGVGVPGSTYAVQRTSALDGGWTTVDTLTVPAGGDGSFSFADPNPPATAAFYRLAQQ